MTWVAVAVGVGGALIGSAASRSAARSQQQAARDASAAQLAMFNQNRQDIAPWRTAGAAGLDELMMRLGIRRPTSDLQQDQRNFDETAYLRANPDVAAWMQANPDQMTGFEHWQRYGRGEGRGYSWTPEAQQRNAQGGDQGGQFGEFMRDFRPSDYEADPGYQFRLGQGEQAINRNAMARGRYNSGSVLKALQDFNSGLASQEYGNAFNRFRTQQGDRYNRLASLSGLGQTTTQQVNADRTALGGSFASNMIGAGNAAAAGRIGSTNAILGGVGQGLNWWQGQQAVNALRGQRTAPIADNYYRSPDNYYRSPYSGYDEQ